MTLSTRTDAYWDIFVTECLRLKAPLYLRLTQGIRGDPLLNALALKAKPGQPIANMLFGAVHYLLLRGAEHPLRAHYRTLGTAEPKDDPFPLFRDFCLTRQSEIADIVATRVTNTNEVARSALLYAGFSFLKTLADGPFHLIEIGPSAGLNMFWDRYSYRFVREGVETKAGAENSELVLRAEVSGNMPPLGPPPSIGRRVGLERDPVDLSDDTDRDWLRALVWPDHPERLTRLETALVAAKNFQPEIREGDALETLSDALAQMPPQGTLCVFHTMATYQFSREDLEALEAMLTIAGLRRPVWRLSMEWDNHDYPLVLSRYEGGAITEQILAQCGAHGASLAWQAEYTQKL